MKTNIISFMVPVVMALFIACNSLPPQQENRSYGEIARQESVEPVRPGIPGERPFWNTYAKRFIYAPAFDFKHIKNAEKYRFDIISHDSSATYSFEANKPYEPLTPVWAELPVGSYHIQVTGVANDGKAVALAGERKFYRAAPFDGIYHKASIPYDSSAKIALSSLLHKDYLNHWLEHKSPDELGKEFGKRKLNLFHFLHISFPFTPIRLSLEEKLDAGSIMVGYKKI